jgi:citrate lyase subunit beta/citryl-CoA lyase
MFNNTTLRRSLLGIPGNERQLVNEAMSSNTDEIFLDLEDSLGPGEKESARSDLIEIVGEHDWDELVLSYRINGTDTRWWYNDIIDVVTAVGDNIDSLIIPKAGSAAEVQTVDTLLTSVETKAGLDIGSIGLNAQIETANGMNAVEDIAHASDRLTAIIFGPADYAASIGATHGASDYPGHYWHYPLSKISHAAASAGLLAIGGPFTDPDNSEEFAQTCRLERALGYDGKVVINPEQVATANDVFTPDVEKVRRAQRIVKEYEQTDSETLAAIDGKVIDREMYRIAKQILTKSEEADLI